MAKYDWSKLKRKYILGESKTLKEFAEQNGISYHMLRQNSKGWRKARITKESQKTDKIIEKTEAAQIQREVDRNLKHLTTWDAFLDMLGTYSSETLQAEVNKSSLGIDNIEKLARIMERVQRGQRLAMGLDNPKASPGAETVRTIPIIHIDAAMTDEQIAEMLKGDKNET